MAKLKDSVARSIKQGCTVKEIVQAVMDSNKYSKWDAVKAFLWSVWLKFLRNKVVQTVVNIILFAIVVIMTVVLMALFGSIAVVGVLTSPLWYPLRIWLAPRSAAELIVITDNTKDTDERIWIVPFKISYLIASGIFFYSLKWLWSWVWKVMPMKKRQYFIDATGIKLSTLKVEQQVAYYNLKYAEAEKEQKDSLRVAIDVCLKMSSAAKQVLWDAGKFVDRKVILAVEGLNLDRSKAFFDGDEKSFNVMCNYCKTKASLPEEVQSFFLEKLESSKPLEKERAEKLLRECCDNAERKLEDSTLKKLINLLSGEHGSIAYNLLDCYWSHYTFSRDVVQELMRVATLQVEVGDKKCNDFPYDIFLKVVSRDGLVTEQAEFFFEHCDNAQEEEVSKILKMREDLESVAYKSDVQDNRTFWKKYCTVNEEISPEAQLKMVEWQYNIYHESGKQLSEDVIYELLVKEISRQDMDYFKKVLQEGIERDVLSERAIKLIKMTEWKRDLLMDFCVKA